MKLFTERELSEIAFNLKERFLNFLTNGRFDAAISIISNIQLSNYDESTRDMMVNFLPSFFEYFSNKDPAKFNEFFLKNNNFEVFIISMFSNHQIDKFHFWKSFAKNTFVPEKLKDLSYLHLNTPDKLKAFLLDQLALFAHFVPAARQSINDYVVKMSLWNNEYPKIFQISSNAIENKIRTEQLKLFTHKLTHLLPVLSAMTQMKHRHRDKSVFYVVALTMLEVPQIFSKQEKNDLLQPFLSAVDKTTCHNGLLNGTLLFQLKSKLMQKPEYKSLIEPTMANRLF